MVNPSPSLRGKERKRILTSDSSVQELRVSTDWTSEKTKIKLTTTGIVQVNEDEEEGGESNIETLIREGPQEAQLEVIGESTNIIFSKNNLQVFLKKETTIFLLFK